MLVGASGIFAPPPGGLSNIFRFESLDNAVGCVARYFTQAGANPTTKGCQMIAAMQRGLSAGLTNFAPFVFAQLTNPNVQGVAYMLGLGDSGDVILRKGDLASGLPDVAPGSQGVLGRSTGSSASQTWRHLMLEVAVNPNGDAVVNAYGNDLTLHTVSTPVWTAIPGIASFIDDPCGINSGTPGLTAGRLGFGFHTSDVARVALFDAVKPLRQT